MPPLDSDGTDETLAASCATPTDTGHAATLASPDASSSDAAAKLLAPADSYQFGTLLGRGGMGEVHAADDLRIGRTVAIKRMRDTSPSPGAVARFFHEAKIQAQLEHPAIVPIYELGVDKDGKPFFAMK